MTQTSAAQQSSGQTTDKTAIRPFQVSFPDAELTELRRRINPTRWPERETVADASQGVQLGTVQKLAQYWGTEYDWRRCEAQLNVLNFITEIDGLDIHFIHVRSKHENALPLKKRFARASDHCVSWSEEAPQRVCASFLQKLSFFLICKS